MQRRAALSLLPPCLKPIRSTCACLCPQCVRRGKMLYERGEKVALEAQTRGVNNIVLQADTSPSTAAAVSGSVPAAGGLTCTSLPQWGLVKNTRPWRIMSPGHEWRCYPLAEQAECRCNFENRQKGSSGGVSEGSVSTGRGRGNLIPIDLNASSVGDDFLGHNGRRMEK